MILICIFKTSKLGRAIESFLCCHHAMPLLLYWENVKFPIEFVWCCVCRRHLWANERFFYQKGWITKHFCEVYNGIWRNKNGCKRAIPNQIQIGITTLPRTKDGNSSTILTHTGFPLEGSKKISFPTQLFTVCFSMPRPFNSFGISYN